MSHFSVLVIGPEVEKQLQPFHEFECTGTNDEFVQEIDRTAEALQLEPEAGETLLATIESWYGWKAAPFGTQPDIADAHKYGYVLLNEAGEPIKCVDRTNPNKRWDWWEVGGRWSGFLKLKEGAHGELGRKGLMGSCAADGPGRADVALARDVDFAGMRDEAGKDAGERWDKSRVAIAAAARSRRWP